MLIFVTNIFDATQTVKITKEDMAKWKVLIAVPCYDQSVTESFMMSLLDSSIFQTRAGIQFSITTISDSLISRARNLLVAKFMAMKEYTHLMFIDADIGFPRDAIIRLLWHNKDIITASYPIKEIDWGKVEASVKAGVTGKDILEKSTRFVVNPIQVGQQEIEHDHGAISVYDAGTGFMLVKREAFEWLFSAYPHLKFVDDTRMLTEEENKYAFALFNSFVENDRFLSEDYGFCRYWQMSGGKIWTDPTIGLTHVGRIKYSGTMVNQLNELIAGGK